MASQWYLESTTAPGLRFKILNFDRATKRAKLLGDTGVPFETALTDEVLEQYHYRIVRVEASESEGEAQACAST